MQLYFSGTEEETEGSTWASLEYVINFGRVEAR